MCTCKVVMWVLSMLIGIGSPILYVRDQVSVRRQSGYVVVNVVVCCRNFLRSLWSSHRASCRLYCLQPAQRHYTWNWNGHWPDIEVATFCFFHHHWMQLSGVEKCKWSSLPAETCSLCVIVILLLCLHSLFSRSSSRALYFAC